MRAASARGESMKKPSLLPLTQCEGCGTIYRPEKPWQRFHSAKCRNEHHYLLRAGTRHEVLVQQKDMFGWRTLSPRPQVLTETLRAQMATQPHLRLIDAKTRQPLGA
jgi:hypothetical protein